MLIYGYLNPLYPVAILFYEIKFSPSAAVTEGVYFEDELLERKFWKLTSNIPFKKVVATASRQK